MERPSQAERMLRDTVKAFTAAVVSASILSLLILAQAIRVQDQEAVRASEREFQGLLALIHEHLALQTRDYAIWGDAVVNIVETTEPEWWQINITDHAIPHFGLSLGLAVSGPDQPYFLTATEENWDTAADLQLPASIRALLAQAQAKSIDPDDGAAVARGVVQWAGKQHLAAAARLAYDSGAPPMKDPDAILLFARKLDDVLAEISQVMGGVEFDDSPQDRKTRYSVRHAITLADGSSAGSLHWAARTPARPVLLGVGGWILLVILFVAAMAMLFLRRARVLGRQLHRDDTLRQQLAARSESLLRAAGDGIFGVGASGTVTFANPAALQILGCEAENFVGQLVRKVIRCPLADGAPEPRAPSPLHQALTAGIGGASDVESFMRCDGSCVPVEYVVSQVTDGNGEMVVVFRDISRRRALEAEITYRANYDALTGLPNRGMLLDRIGHDLALARRFNRTAAVLFLDLDGFKEVNDSFGHRAGDLLLQQVAKRLTDSTRESDTVARHGGDEFVILVPSLENEAAAEHVARAVLDALEAPFSVEDHAANIGTSIGIALYPQHGEDADSLLQRADRAMYAAKTAGGGLYRIASS